jgi:hypothetical protein
MNPYKKVLFTFLSFMLVSACSLGTIFPTSQANGVNPVEELRCELGGYAFKTLPDYTVDDSSKDSMGMFRLNSNDIDWGDPNFNVHEGPTIQLYGFVPYSDITIEEWATRDVDQMILMYQATVSGQPQVSVAGLEGIAYDFDYEIPDVGKMRERVINVEIYPTHFLEIRCYSTVEKWEKTLADCEAVINSVTIFEPKPSPTEIP